MRYVDYDDLHWERGEYVGDGIPRTAGGVPYNPLAFRGISRRQWACVRRFVADPPEGPVVVYSDTMHEDGVTADRLPDIDRLPDMTGHRGL